MMLDRDQELMVAGMRPSLDAKVKVGAKSDGTLTAWQSESWGTSGPAGGANANLPYILQTKLPYRRKHTAVHTNIGPARAWRAPRSEEHTSELQSLRHLVCRLLLEKKKTKT